MTRTEKPKSLHLKRRGISEKLKEFQGFPGGASGKEPACQCGRGKRLRFNPWAGKVPWRRKWQPPPVNGQRSLVGCSPRGTRSQTQWKDRAQAGSWASLTGKHGLKRASETHLVRVCVHVCVCAHLCVCACACVCASVRVCVCMHAKSLSCVSLFVTPCMVARQAPLSMRFSRQEYGSGLPSPSPGIFSSVQSLSRLRLFSTP